MKLVLLAQRLCVSILQGESEQRTRLVLLTVLPAYLFLSFGVWLPVNVFVLPHLYSGEAYGTAAFFWFPLCFLSMGVLFVLVGYGLFLSLLFRGITPLASSPKEVVVTFPETSSYDTLQHEKAVTTADDILEATYTIEEVSSH